MAYVSETIDASGRSIKRSTVPSRNAEFVRTRYSAKAWLSTSESVDQAASAPMHDIPVHRLRAVGALPCREGDFLAGSKCHFRIRDSLMPQNVGGDFRSFRKYLLSNSFNRLAQSSGRLDPDDKFAAFIPASLCEVQRTLPFCRGIDFDTRFFHTIFAVVCFLRGVGKNQTPLIV